MRGGSDLSALLQVMGGSYNFLPYNLTRNVLGDNTPSIKTHSSREVKTFSPKVWKETDHTKIGRNDLCHCGSNKKYKKCCGGIE